ARLIPPCAAASSVSSSNADRTAASDDNPTWTAPASHLWSRWRLTSLATTGNPNVSASLTASSVVGATTVGTSGNPKSFSTRRVSSPVNQSSPRLSSTARHTSRASAARISSKLQKSAGGCDLHSAYAAIFPSARAAFSGNAYTGTRSGGESSSSGVSA